LALPLALVQRGVSRFMTCDVTGGPLCWRALAALAGTILLRHVTSKPRPPPASSARRAAFGRPSLRYQHHLSTNQVVSQPLRCPAAPCPTPLFVGGGLPPLAHAGAASLSAATPPRSSAVGGACTASCSFFLSLPTLAWHFFAQWRSLPGPRSHLRAPAHPRGNFLPSFATECVIPRCSAFGVARRGHPGAGFGDATLFA